MKSYLFKVMIYCNIHLNLGSPLVSPTFAFRSFAFYILSCVINALTNEFLALSIQQQMMAWGWTKYEGYSLSRVFKMFFWECERNFWPLLFHDIVVFVQFDYRIICHIPMYLCGMINQGKRGNPLSPIMYGFMPS